VSLIPFRRRAPSTKIALGEPLRATPRWTTEAPGIAAVLWWIDGASGSAFLSDGFPAAWAHLELRRFDLATGIELGHIRTGSKVRCFAFLPGGDELIAATDTRLLRLEATSLAERQRWETRIPRFSDYLVVVNGGGGVAVANFVRPTVAIVDLGSGSVRRRSVMPRMHLLPLGERLLAVGANEPGGILTVDPRSAGASRLADAPPAIDVAVDPDGTAVWSTVGVRDRISSKAYGPGQPTAELRRQALDSPAAVETFVLPARVRRLRLGRAALWLAHHDVLVSLELPIGSGPARVWRPPPDDEIATFDPDTRTVIVKRRAAFGNPFLVSTALEIGP
jgi:hypothetical protein